MWLGLAMLATLKAGGAGGHVRDCHVMAGAGRGGWALRSAQLLASPAAGCWLFVPMPHARAHGCCLACYWQ